LTDSAPPSTADRTFTLLRVLGATAVAWMFVDAAFSTPARPGVSTFGNPPELAIAWFACGAVWASLVVRARDRLAIARRLVLALLVATLLGRRVVPADAGLRLALMGVALWAAAPWLRPRPGFGATTAALVLALPALLLTEFPQGDVLWLGYVLPPAALALLVPAVLPGRGAFRAAAALVLATGAVCLAALATYPALARGLQLPLPSVLPTRLHLLGLHPNLAVPHLATTIVLGAALLASSTRRWRLALLAALLPVAGALLAIGSRTGLLATAFGVGLLLLDLLPERLAQWAHRLAIAGVAALLIFPLTGWSDASITRTSSNMVSKAVSFRSAMWELGRDTLAGAPWHGFGPGTAYAQGRFARPSRYDGLPKDDHPHNVLLAAGGALGWPGLLGLGILFVAGVRRPRAGGTLAHAAAAAALAMWAANAIDMGGADATLYPSLAFLLLGLRQAAPRPDDPGRGAPPAARARRVAVAAGALLVLLGALWFAGEALEESAVEHVAEIAEAKDGGFTAHGQGLIWAARLQPLDPNIPAQQARLATLQGDRAGAVAALERAVALFPGSAALARQLALAHSAVDPRDPRVEQLLAQAVRLDPYGPDAWRAHRDLAAVRALAGDASGARDALVAAVLLNPGAAAGLPTRGADEALELLPAGEPGASVPLRDLLAELVTRRAALAEHDPASETRLRMREVEILRALGQTERADEAARVLVAGEPVYLARQLAQSALARGRPEEAVARIREVGTQGHFWNTTDLVEALSRASPPDEAAYSGALADALVILARDVDLVFELPTVARLLEAQRRWAERRGDAEAALRYADALEFAAR
jgi:tetratricopeptide (TPR) repeat protein/O-antigen ligase